MDIIDYISSGILERYVLGDVSSQERKEVECMSHIYPEILNEVSVMQAGIEKLALKLAVPTPISLKKKVLEAVKQTAQTKSDETQETPVVQMTPKRNYTRIAVAASVLVILGLGGWNFLLQDNVNTAKDQLASANTTIDNLEEDLDQLTTEYTSVSDQIAFINDPNTSRINLAGTDNYPTDGALVYWNPVTEKVFLETNSLPENVSNESYQLWVLVDGTPKSMGVFEKEVEEKGTFLEMELTNEADAFAITLEPLGGSESPTLENLVVIGTI